MKGIILAGGNGSRLSPITQAVCKQLLPVYDKPMIYYPLSVLMLAGIRDILIISSPKDIPRFKDLLGTGRHLGISISYKIQKKPKGIAEAFLIGRDFIKNSPVCLILGDNIFYGHDLVKYLQSAVRLKQGGMVFGYNVHDPQQYGVIELSSKNRIVSIEEKPVQPKSNWAVTGIYFYDRQVVKIAEQIKPSNRGELEITDINKAYLKKNLLKVQLLGRGFAWLDTGTYDSLISASLFIKTIEERQGLKIGSPEEIAYEKKYINKTALKKLAENIPTAYGTYLLRKASL